MRRLNDENLEFLKEEVVSHNIKPLHINTKRAI